MTDIFIKKSRWFDFANEHNKKANVGATLLNGSNSYTLAALYIAAGREIPLSIRLDTARAKGVADHFNGLRMFYESGKEPNRWIKSLAGQCRKFAIENSLDSDDMIRKVIMLTDRNVYGTDAYCLDISKQTHVKFQADGYLPVKEDVYLAESQLRKYPDELINMDAVLDQVEDIYNHSGKSLRGNWRVITKQEIPNWFSKNRKE